jgi:Glycosyltransferase family 87
VSPTTELRRKWIASFLRCLTPRRLRAQAIVLAVCLWGVCAVDFAHSGMFDRAGNIKFQDLLPIYISSRLVAQHRATDLYNQDVQRNELQSIVGATHVEIPYLYGPQLAVLFAPMTKFSFSAAAKVWAAFSLLLYFSCLYVLWNYCPTLRRAKARHPEAPPLNKSRKGYRLDRQVGLPATLSPTALVILAAIAFPPLFHVFVRGQISALILLCFTAAFLAFRAKRDFLAGVAVGFLIVKPQFLVAIPVVLFCARAWRPLTGVVLSAAAQLSLTRLYSGSSVMQNYFGLLFHPANWITSAELQFAPIQMHSLRSFWSLLIPSSTIAFVLYALTSVFAVAITVCVWKSDSPLAIRFSALTLAAILVNPHLFIYDLLVLAPVLLLVVDCALSRWEASITAQLLVLSYLAFVLPLFGPLSRWTHLQLSVLAFTALLWTLFCFATRGHGLASSQTPVV